MTAIIVIPYSPSPLREFPYQCVMSHLEHAPWPIAIARDDRKPFPLAQTMNVVIQQTAAEILILHAADVVVPIAQMEIAVELASKPGLVGAYDEYIRLTEAGERGKPLRDTSVTACAAIRRDCWDKLGGYDEGYVGWGMEDRDICRRAEEFWPTRTVPGELIHFWHGDRRRDDSDLETPPEIVNANWQRFRATA